MGERRESNPRMLEPQPSALTTWLRSPKYLVLLNYTNNITIFHNLLPIEICYYLYLQF